MKHVRDTVGAESLEVGEAGEVAGRWGVAEADLNDAVGEVAELLGETVKVEGHEDDRRDAGWWLVGVVEPPEGANDHRVDVGEDPHDVARRLAEAGGVGLEGERRLGAVLGENEESPDGFLAFDGEQDVVEVDGLQADGRAD